MSHISLAHSLWAKHLRSGDTVIDATAGNGHDALCLAKLILTDAKGHLHVMDIQEAAIKATKKRLQNALATNVESQVTYHLQSHECLPDCNPHLVVYNLGYLPGSDRSITTKKESSLASIKLALKQIAPSGMLSIMFYPGHSEGFDEQKLILPYLDALDPKAYEKTHYQNKDRKAAPHLYVVKKI